MNSESIQMDFLRCVFFCAPSDLKASQKQAHTGRKDTVCLFFFMYLMWRHLVAKYATTASGAMLLINLIQVTESISGSVVPLAMFFIFFA